MRIDLDAPAAVPEGVGIVRLVQGSMAILLCLSLHLAAANANDALGECTCREVDGQRVLDRHVGPFSAKGETVETIWLTLVSDHGVPVSFIQADAEAKVSLDLREATVRQVLDAVVTSAPGYRYDVVGDRLVLFLRSHKWGMRLEGFTLGPAPRLVVARDLAHELSQRAPAFAGLSGPSQRGSINSFVYRDTVTVVAPGTAVGLLVQLLGQRPTAVFSIARNPWGFFGLELGGVHLLRSLVLLAPTTTLRDRAEIVQLKLIGKVNEDERIDLTAAKCGTAYASSDERVVAVSEEGLVKVCGSGRAVVTARNEGEVSALPFTVSLPAEPEGDTLKPPKCTAINSGSTTRMSW